MQTRASHGVFGYTQPVDKVTDEVVAYLDRMHGFKVSTSIDRQ